MNDILEMIFQTNYLNNNLENNFSNKGLNVFLKKNFESMGMLTIWMKWLNADWYVIELNEMTVNSNVWIDLWMKLMKWLFD